MNLEPIRNYYLKLSLFFITLLSGLFFCANGQNKSEPSNVTLEYQHLHSKIFNNTRTLRILLPPGYYNSGKNKIYKVLFLNDGQSLFNNDTCQFSHNEWRVDETVDSLINMKKIEPFIIVGIDNIGSKYRGKEYLPWEDIYLSPPIPHPMGPKYPDFIINEVLPFVKSKYRISTKREDIGVGGSSYGALIALYTYLKKPDDIGFLLLESPSFYVNEQAILKMFKSFNGALPEKISIGVGTNELALKNCDESNPDNLMAVRDATNLQDMFLSKGLDKKRLLLTVGKCAIHREKAWAGRFPKDIQFLMHK